ncbi:MAG: hypothetical protein ACREPS_10985, partial [Rhodanobacteraceae bacterium]
MKPIGNIIGFDVVVHSCADMVDVAVHSGAVVQPDGRKRDYKAFAFSTDIEGHDRFRVCFEDRALARKVPTVADLMGTPDVRVVKHRWRDFIDGTAPGLYPGGLVVVGTVDVPPKSTTSAHKRARHAANARYARETPKTRAKGAAHALFLERHEGKHPKLRTNEDFATECVKRWPELKQSTLTRKWCPQ